MTLDHVGREASTGRNLLVAELGDLEDWPDEPPLPTPHFIVLTAFNAERLELNALKRFAAKLLRQGCVYACAWGPDCVKVHLAFDLAYIEAREGKPCDADSDVMTTWHADESLDEALYYAIFDAWSSDYEHTTLAVVAIVEPALANHVRSRLSDTSALKKDVLDPDSQDSDPA